MKTLLVDGSYLIYRTMHVKELSSLTDSKRRPTGAVFGFLRALKASIALLRPIVVFVAWDKGGSYYRSSIYPEYKQNRKKDDKEFYESYSFQKKVLNKLLPMFGVRQIEIPGVEGDDILWKLSRISKFHPATVMTDDRDLLQLVNSEVRVYRPIADEMVTDENFEELAGITKDKFILRKAMIGDTSDNVAGIRGIAEKTAKPFLSVISTPTVDSVVEVAKQNLKSVRSQRIVEGRDILNRNIKLMDLSLMPWSTEQLQSIKDQIKAPVTLKDKELYPYVAKLGMKSITDNYITFLRPFRRLR